MANVGAVGSSDVALGDSDVEDEVAGSKSIREGGESGTLNTDFGGFFKASMHFWISGSRCNGLM
uniref:Uncharacterized protein n=1 Tax=Romanomermis culicivorax TaxID=13658 RepID=A0A915JVF0_ROMCU